MRLRRLGSRLGSLGPKVARRQKVALPFYRLPEWPALVARLIKERGRRCERCLTTGGRIYGDHRVELKDGGAALDPRNIELLCAKCHGAKTEAERRKRVGLDLGGKAEGRGEVESSRPRRP